jgi:arylsulfatase A-like enzyme
MRGEKVIEYPVDQTTLTKRYTEEAVRFIDQNRDESFFLYLPHTMVHLPLAASEEFQGKTASLLGDAIAEVDWSVGQILDAVDEAGIGRKTLVIFTSDNGAAVGSSKPLRAKKASLYDGGIREPTVMRWTDTIPAGTTCNEVAATIDLMPTLASFCYGDLPERKIDGKDITPLVMGAKHAKSPHDAYVLMHNKGCVRAGQWKFYPWPEGQERGRGNADVSAEAPSVQLYEIGTDIGETKNVAAERSDVVARLQRAYDEHVAEIQANRRPTAKLRRPAGSPAASRP